MSPVGAGPYASLVLSTVYAPAEPVSLRLTLAPLRRGQYDPTFRADASGVWRSTRTPLGGATLHLRRVGETIEATAWGDGAEWAIASLPELLGAGDDLDGFDVSATPFLADAARRAVGMRMLRTAQVLEALIPAILEQKVTGVESRRAWRTLVTAYGDPAPGPAPHGMRVPPDAQTWRRIPSWEWHRAGVGPNRSAAILRAVAVAPALERTLAHGRGGPVVEAALRTIPGVGVWTAAETMQRAHGDPDSPSVGDYHLPALVGWALIGRPVDDDGMLELLEPWRGHRHRVVRLIEASGFEKPRFGPRMTIEDHRGR